MSRSALLADPAELVARPYLERADNPPTWPDRVAEAIYHATLAPLHERLWASPRRLAAIVASCERHDRGLANLTDAELAGRLRALGPRLRRQSFALELAGECFALLREASGRTLGQRHYETQLMGGWALLEGKLVEMATGEGKTLTATLPACAAALAGYRVHIITVNDYLAGRDAEEMGPLYRFLGLDVGTVVQGMAPAARRLAYAQPITYCTNKELAFDYLRDRVALGRRDGMLHLALEKVRGDTSRADKVVLGGLHFGIVDEVDSVFVDEARTPLILSSSQPNVAAGETCRQAIEFVRTLGLGADYKIDWRDKQVELSEGGRAKLDAFAEALTGLWCHQRSREALACQAISALQLYHRDEHYVVTDGKVQIVDESTGRILPDRSWERGLHQMIEAKEGCALSEERTTLARITYQRLFRRYVRLAGMSGTAREVAPEIRAVYRLEVVDIPLHLPCRRRHGPLQLFADSAEKWQAVAEAVERVARCEGRPVLIGTRSVRASEEISAVLTRRGIAHALLNAKQDKDEAAVIAAAGQPGCVTVATNMAGRGTDIRLGAGVAERGGLHVILTEFHESRRIDRQLFGRCARQGDPGSCAAMVSLDDELFAVHAPLFLRLVQRVFGGRPPRLIAHGLRRIAQGAAERKNAQQRIRNLKLDRSLDRVLAFSGRNE